MLTISCRHTACLTDSCWWDAAIHTHMYINVWISTYTRNGLCMYSMSKNIDIQGTSLIIENILTGAPTCQIMSID